MNHHQHRPLARKLCRRRAIQKSRNLFSVETLPLHQFRFRKRISLHRGLAVRPALQLSRSQINRICVARPRALASENPNSWLLWCQRRLLTTPAASLGRGTSVLFVVLRTWITLAPFSSLTYAISFPLRERSNLSISQFASGPLRTYFTSLPAKYKYAKFKNSKPAS